MFKCWLSGHVWCRIPVRAGLEGFVKAIKISRGPFDPDPEQYEFSYPYICARCGKKEYA